MNLASTFDDPRWVRTALYTDGTGSSRMRLLIVWRGQAWIVRYPTLRLDVLWTALEAFTRDPTCALSRAVTRPIFRDICQKTVASSAVCGIGPVVTPSQASQP